MPNLLIVDDEQSILDSLALLLEEMGHAIDTAENGSAALQYVEAKDYDLILSDIHMPGMDGFELLQAVRNRPAGATPFVFMTGYKDASTNSRLLNEKIDGLIYKPFDTKTIQKIIAGALDAKSENDPSGVDVPVADAVNASGKGKDALYGIGELLFEYKTLEALSEACVRSVGTHLNCQETSLVIVNRHRTEIKCQMHFDKTEGLDTALPAYNEPVLRWMAANNRTLHVVDLSQSNDNPIFNPQSQQTGSILAVPIRRKSCILGMLIMRQDKAGGFTDDDLYFADPVAKLLYGRIENMDLYDDLKRYFNSTILTLMTIMKFNNKELYRHSGRVGRWVMKIARKLKLSEVEARRLEYVTLLHDIGKMSGTTPTGETVAYPASAEKLHVELGSVIMRHLTFVADGETIVRHHHEAFDGTGWPDGLKGNAIPLFSRVITLADHFEHFIERDDDLENAFDDLRREAGKKLDPQLVELFVGILEEEAHGPNGEA